MQESLSVSGILLGKTMGRTNELADRFEADSLRLADLEVRQRMAGRWVMASIQTSFAIMPAAVYWFGGARARRIVSIATLVAFTTLQTRLFFPVGSLLGVSLDVQTSLALFDRIFEYLDQPVDIEEKPGRAAGRARRATSCSTTCGSATATTRGRSRTSASPCRPARRRRSSARPARARRRSATSPRASTTSSEGSVSIGGVDVRDLTFEALSDLVGVVSQETYLFHASVRENLRFAKPDATDEEIEAAAEAARIHHVIAALPEGYDTVVGERGYRFSGGEKQRIAIARTDPAQPADPRPRRGDELARHRDGAARAGGARPARRGADDDRDRAPPLDRPRRRPDRRPRRAAASSSAARTRS